MNEVAAIAPAGSVTELASSTQVTVAQFPSQGTTAAPTTQNVGFETLLGDAIATLDSKVAEADRMVAKFAVDESTPIHHVTVALEEARMAVELATQVRQRVTEGYRELMNMQL